MDRPIVYSGAIPLDTDLLGTNKDAMIGLGYALQAILGTGTVVDGLACTPTGPAGMTVNVAPGSIMSLQNVDGTAYGSLAPDTTHQIVKQGIVIDTTNLSCPAPGSVGQSINYLIQAAYQDVDSGATVLPYYNAANPASAFNGPNNTGVSQNTVRKGACLVQVKAGVAATTGSQTTPAPDAGFTGLYAVTVANGQTTITSGNINPLATAPFISPKLPGIVPTMQAGAFGYATDTSGAANTISVSLTPAVASLTNGMAIRVKVANTTTGAPVMNLNGLGNVACYGGDGYPLHAGSLKANVTYTFAYDGAHWVLQGAPADLQTSDNEYSADTGSANAYVATVPGTVTLHPGLRVDVLLANTNTASSTLNLNSTGAVTIKKVSGTSLANVAANDLPGGFICTFEYDGTFWQALNIRTLSGFAPINSPAFTGTPTAPTPGAGDNSTNLATTAFVAGTIRSKKVTVFTSSGTFTTDAKTVEADVEVQAPGGGSGGVTSSSPAVGGSGSAGGRSKGRFDRATLGSSQAVTIGASGTAGNTSGTAGGTGGTTSFGALISCNGGNGGVAMVTGNSTAPAVAGGTATGGDNPVQGAPSDFGMSNTGTATLNWSGKGGASPYGAPGKSVTSGGPGEAAIGYGTGASGALGNGSAQNGAAGAGGLIIVTEYLS
jgi:hypothetical protein